MTQSKQKHQLSQILKNDLDREAYDELLQHLRTGEDINANVGEGNTVLHIIIDKKPELVPLLLELGANFNLENNKGETPLMLAFGKQDGALGLQLIQLGKYCNQQFIPQHKSLLRLATEINVNNDTLRGLIQSGEDVNELVDRKSTLLHLSAVNRPELMLSLITLNADFNLQDTNLDTPLHIAFRHQSIDYFIRMIEACINSGRSIKSQLKNKDGKTIIDLLVESNPLNKTVIALAEAGFFNVNEPVMHAKTLLHLAVKSTRSELAKKLINLGADLYSLTDGDETPFKLALQTDIHFALELVHLARQAGYLINPAGNLAYDRLTAQLIRQLGTNYLQQYKKIRGMFHNNHALAGKMANFDERGSLFDRWLFLAEGYQQLYNHNGTLAVAIRELFTKYFKDYIADIKGLSVKSYSELLINVVWMHKGYFETLEKRPPSTQEFVMTELAEMDAPVLAESATPLLYPYFDTKRREFVNPDPSVLTKLLAEGEGQLALLDKPFNQGSFVKQQASIPSSVNIMDLSEQEINNLLGIAAVTVETRVEQPSRIEKNLQTFGLFTSTQDEHKDLLLEKLKQIAVPDTVPLAQDEIVSDKMKICRIQNCA